MLHILCTVRDSLKAYGAKPMTVNNSVAGDEVTGEW
jgi:hypothetical protein